MCLSGDVEFGLFSIKPSAESLPHIESPEMPPPKKRRQRPLVEMPEEVGAMRPSSQGELFTHVYIFYETYLFLLNVNSSSRATNSCKHRIKREHELQIHIFLNV